MNPARFDLTTLRLFRTAVDAGSLTAAAERLGVSLAAASKRISELESHVGTTLLVRSKAGVQPNDAGRTLYRHALTVTAGVEQLAMAMRDVAQGADQHLKLWGNTSSFSGFLIPILAKYSKVYPETKLDLEDALSEDIVAAVTDGRAELGVVGSNTPLGQLESLVCHVDQLVVAVPAGHPLARERAVTLDMCLAYDLITLHRKTSLMRQVTELAEPSSRPLVLRAQVRNFDAMCRMVSAGLGIAILPRLAAAPLLRTFGLIAVKVPEMPSERRLLLVMRRRQALSQAARRMAEMIESD
jgi:DNA-binding transcriptional LysR family regulator